MLCVIYFNVVYYHILNLVRNMTILPLSFALIFLKYFFGGMISTNLSRFTNNLFYVTVLYLDHDGSIGQDFPEFDQQSLSNLSQIFAHLKYPRHGLVQEIFYPRR